MRDEEGERQMRAAWTLVATAVLALMVLSSAATAQNSSVVDDLRQEFRNEAERSKLGRSFQALSVFNITPGISAASYYVDNDDPNSDVTTIDSYKFSPSHTFDPIHGIKPYVEATVGFLNSEASGQVFVDPNTPTDVSFDIKTIAFLGGGGVEIDIVENTVVRPILLAGYSRIWDSDSISGPGADVLEEAGKGILFDAWLNTFLVGGAVELEHWGSSNPVHDINYTAKIRFNQLYANTYSASDSSLEGGGTFGILTAGAEVDGPLWGVTLLDHEVRWIGFATNTYLPNDQESDALGFDYFFEVGGGLEFVDRTVVSGLEGVSVRSSVLFGNNVYGWTAGLSLEF